MDKANSKWKIMIVEDEHPLRNALMDKFKSEGYRVIGAEDGQTGLEKAGEEKPDLILLDIVMPKLDGLTMLDRLRQSSEYGKNVPVILLTNLNDPEKVADAFNEGVYDYLVKTNWKLEDVVKKVKEKIAKIPTQEE